MSALPTREEIADTVEMELHTMKFPEWPLSYAECLRIANALLARLRPAWEQAARWKLVAETRGSMHDASTCTHAVEANRLKEERDALRADLRACAEALTNIQSAVDDGTVHDASCRVICGMAADAALARPSVQGEGKNA